MERNDIVDKLKAITEVLTIGIGLFLTAACFASVVRAIGAAARENYSMMNESIVITIILGIPGMLILFLMDLRNRKMRLSKSS